MSLRTALHSLLVLPALLAFTHEAWCAEAYPSRPVRVVVAFPPGGISDALARVLSQQLTAAMGQQFIVDNRPGAGTTLAAALIAKAPPDGSTLYLADVTTHAINATLYSSLPFDSVRDFTPVAMVAQTPLILVVHPSLPVRSVRDLVALAPGTRGGHCSGAPYERARRDSARHRAAPPRAFATAGENAH